MVSLNEYDREICRICLELGAAFPVFEKPGDSEETIHNKLFMCINQKIEDAVGLPRYICFKCKTTVDILCEFVHKIKESSKTLQHGLLHIKQEKDDHYNEHQVFLDIDTDYVDDEEEIKHTKFEEPLIKIETNLVGNENGVDDQIQALFKSNELNVKKIKIEPQEKKLKKNRPKLKAKNKTNNIASSILEGSFEWTGRKWCISSTTIKKLSKTAKKKKSEELNEKKQREASIKIPKFKDETQSNRSKLCDICGKTLKTVSIKDHMKSHETPVTVKCKECNKEFNSLNFLNRHIRSMHMERKYVCAECGRTFSLPNHLSSHIKKVHQKHLYPQKSYQCSFCDKTYKAKQSVNIHERSVHTGIRPAECTFCEARFFHEVYLVEHMRLHTGETPYKCPVCGRGYAQRGNMKSHILHNHRISQLTPQQLSQIKPCYLKIMKG